MKRTPLKRKTGLKSKGRIRPRSDKRVAHDALRRAFVARVLDARPGCQAGARIVQSDEGAQCDVWSCDVHEIKTRARGGDTLDEDNVLAICRRCHDWIHEHPSAALALGLLKNSWD